MEDLTFGPRANFTPELLNFVTEEYGLEFPEIIEDIGGTYNLNLLLQMPQEKLVLRVYRPWTTRGRLLVLHSIKKRLAANGFPVALPVSTVSGQTCLEYQGRVIEIEGYVSHDPVEADWEIYRQTFVGMAAFHNFLRENIDAGSFVPAPVSNYASPGTLLEWLEHFEEVVQDRTALEVCARTRQLLLKIDRFYAERAKNLPRQLTHGDWRIGNVVFRDGQLAAILDFDFLDVRERIFDLAYTLYWMFVDLEPGRPPADLSWDKTTEMLSAYNQISSNPLTGAELESLPIIIALVPLYWVGEAVIGPGLIPTLPSYTQNVDMAEWVVAHADELATILRKL